MCRNAATRGQKKYHQRKDQRRMAMSEVSELEVNVGIGSPQAAFFMNLSNTISDIRTVDSEPQEIRLAVLPSYTLSTILDLGEDHYYSMAHEVLLPTVDPRSAIARLERELRWDRENGTGDTVKELQLLYHQRIEGMADFTYVPLLGLIISQAYDRWHQRGRWKDTAVYPAERRRSRLHISAMLYELSQEMADDPRIEFLARAILASLTVDDRSQVLSDLETYMSSQCCA